MEKALLFLNGELPSALPLPTAAREWVVCTDGSFFQLKNANYPLEVISFVCGDFDSASQEEIEQFLPAEKIIPTPNQNFNDFQKALDILAQKGVKRVTVFGGGGGEMDHFLANLTVAYRNRHRFTLDFVDAHSRYFFVEKSVKIESVQGKMISLQPFPYAEKIVSNGLHWEWQGASLDITENSGSRNFAVEETVELSLDKGTILLFVSHENYKG